MPCVHLLVGSELWPMLHNGTLTDYCFIYRQYFKKSERFQAPSKAYQERHNVHFDPDYHGTDGPLHTVYSAEFGASTQYWQATLNNLGVESNRSHQSGSNVGCFTALSGIDPQSQERCYSARAYYLPASDRKNLVLLTEATVQNVILEKKAEGEDWIATGIRLVHKGQHHTVHVEGEVIISAGSIQSPQVLEFSGIGNPEILKAAGIETKVASPNVGENFQEHLSKCSKTHISMRPSNCHSDNYGI